MLKGKKWLIIVIPVIYYVMLAFIFYGKVSVKMLYPGKSIEITAPELFGKTKDLMVKGNTVTALSDDPRIEIDINEPMTYVDIGVESIDRNGVENDKGQIFWANAGEAFDYEQSLKFDLKTGENIIELPTREYGKLRIDLMSHEGVTVSLQFIKLYMDAPLTRLNLFWFTYFVLVVITLFIVGIFSYLKKKHIRLFNIYEIREQGERILNVYFQFYQRHKIVIWLNIFICICIYGYETFNFTLGGDEEREAVLSALNAKVYGMDVDVSMDNFLLVIGRYGNWLFRKLFMYQGTFTPTYTMLVALVFLLLSVITWCIIFEQLLPSHKISDIEYILFGGIFMSVPYASAGFMGYSILNSSSTCAMFLCALVLLILNLHAEQKDKTAYIVGIILVQFAIATYQCHVNDFILGSCICVFLYIWENNIITIRKCISNCIRYIVVFVGGLLLYVFCDRVIVANIIEKSTYTDAFFSWGTEPLHVTLMNVAQGIAELFYSEDVPGYPYLLIGLAVYIFSLVLFSLKRKTLSGKLIMLVVGGGIIPCAYTVSIALGDVLHWGTHSAVLLLIGFCWFFSLISLKQFLRRKIVYCIVVAMALLVLFRQVDIDNRIYYGGHLVSELDMELGYRLGTEIEQAVSDEGIKKPLVIIGKYRHNSPVIIECGMEGRSLFLRKHNYKTWYLNYLGFPFKVADETTYEKAFEIGKELPVWPKDGCIIETDDCIIVHLSNLY